MKRYPLAHKIDTTHPYTPKDASDIRKTFARVRKQQAVQAEPAGPVMPPLFPNSVTPIRKAKP